MRRRGPENLARPQPAQTFGHGALGQVRAAHLVAQVQQHLGDAAHSRAADADEVHALDLVFHLTARRLGPEQQLQAAVPEVVPSERRAARAFAERRGAAAPVARLSGLDGLCFMLLLGSRSLHAHRRHCRRRVGLGERASALAMSSSVSRVKPSSRSASRAATARAAARAPQRRRRRESARCASGGRPPHAGKGTSTLATPAAASSETVSAPARQITRSASRVARRHVVDEGNRLGRHTRGRVVRSQRIEMPGSGLMGHRRALLPGRSAPAPAARLR